MTKLKENTMSCRACKQGEEDRIHNALRQEALYNYLAGRGNEWSTRKQIAEAIGFYTGSEGHISDRITEDVHAINEDLMFEKIVLTGPKGVKLATKKEAIAAYNAGVDAHDKRVHRLHQIWAKHLLDGTFDKRGKKREAYLAEGQGK